MKRHRDALGIQEGARNVRAMARTLVEASDEAAREGIGAEHDAAVRMIVHQLARVCRVDEINNDFDPETLRDVYCILMEECRTKAEEMTIGDEEVTVIMHEPEQKKQAPSAAEQRVAELLRATAIPAPPPPPNSGKGK